MFFVNILRYIVRWLFGGKQSKSGYYQREQQERRSNNQRNTSSQTSNLPNKVIGKDEGEYVDFEEID